EGAQPQKVLALLGQLDVLAHHLFDAGRVLDLQELVFRDKRHGQLPVVSSQLSVFGLGLLIPHVRFLVAQASSLCSFYAGWAPPTIFLMTQAKACGYKSLCLCRAGALAGSRTAEGGGSTFSLSFPSYTCESHCFVKSRLACQPLAGRASVPAAFNGGPCPPYIFIPSTPPPSPRGCHRRGVLSPRRGAAGAARPPFSGGRCPARG